jgi:hypothetical protein
VTCSLLISPSVTWPRHPLSLAEVRLYGPTGERVPPGSIALVLSSTSSERRNKEAAAVMCNDGSTRTYCQTMTPEFDPRPQLRVLYQCDGVTSLSTVEVASRADRQAYLQQYRLDFYNLAGMQERPGYVFTQAQDKHTVSVMDETGKCNSCTGYVRVWATAAAEPGDWAAGQWARLVRHRLLLSRASSSLYVCSAALSQPWIKQHGTHDVACQL